jgi:hypothetical protein
MPTPCSILYRLQSFDRRTLLRIGPLSQDVDPRLLRGRALQRVRTARPRSRHRLSIESDQHLHGRQIPDNQDQRCGMVPHDGGAPAARCVARTRGCVASRLPAVRERGKLQVPPPAGVPVGVGNRPAGGNVTEWLQAVLNRLGADPQLVVDGCHGRHTRCAVTAFQAARGLCRTGLLGLCRFQRCVLSLPRQGEPARWRLPIVFAYSTRHRATSAL